MKPQMVVLIISSEQIQSQKFDQILDRITELMTQIVMSYFIVITMRDKLSDEVRIDIEKRVKLTTHTDSVFFVENFRENKQYPGDSVEIEITLIDVWKRILCNVSN